MKELYSEQLEYIDKLCELNGCTIDQLEYWVIEATDNEYTSFISMDPSYIYRFIEVLNSDEDLIHPGDE